MKKKWNLPPNWNWIPLSDLITDMSGGTWGTDDDPNGPAVLRPNNIGLDGYVIFEDLRFREIPLGQLKKQKLCTGDVILTKSNSLEQVGRCAFFIDPQDGKSYVASNFLQRLRFNENRVNPKYGFWFLYSKMAREYFQSQAKGSSASLKNLTSDVISSLEFPIPIFEDQSVSLQIQNQIVERIEALFAELSEARRLHDKIVADSNRLMDAVLAEVFPNPENALEKGWILRTVEELSTDPQYGYTASANKQSDGVKFLRITDIQNGIVDWSKVPSCDCNKRDVDQYGLRDGDIVFARTGATTGKTFLVRQPPEAIFASYLIRLQITKLASPDFVYWYFQSPYYWQQINPRGGAQPNMNAQLLKKVRIPVPESFALQDQIVERILSVKSEIDGMQEQSKETGALLANLESSILAQAFRGEL